MKLSNKIKTFLKKIYTFLFSIPISNWTVKKMSYVAILVATSVVFIMIFMRILPFTAIPSFKIMAGGLPIKITGYIFGPLVGALTGILADLISFAFFPIAFHPFYTLAFALAGFIPGVVGFLFNRRWRDYDEVQESFMEKVNLVNFYGTIIILTTVILGVGIFLSTFPNEYFETALVKNKTFFILFACFGTTTMLIAVIIMRFVLTPSNFNSILPIIAFSAIIELICPPIITLGDLRTIYNGEGQQFLNIFTINLFWSPIKIWANMIVILIAYKIVSPLIFKKQSNSWGK